MKLPSFLADLSISPLEYYKQAFAWCTEMRLNNPVAFDENRHVWLLFRYDDAVRLRSDYKTFSSVDLLARENSPTRGESIISMDPPRHRQMRSLITQAFSAHTIAQMAPQIAQIVDGLIDHMLPQQAIDWMQALANPLPVMVISDMLGLPREEWQQFKTWTDTIVSHPATNTPAHDHFTRYFTRAIDERRHFPRNDILSLLIAAEVDGERLSQQHLLDFCFTLFIAGNVTTTATLGNALICFDQHPEELARLRQQPELVPSAIEEILRTMPPGRVGPNDLVNGRMATTDVQFGEQWIRKGDRILTITLANNFDSSQFPDAERFTIQRNPNRHLSFGHGIHFCIGAPLARLELKVAWGKILQRLPGLHLLHEVPLHVVANRIMFGPRQLPVVFEDKPPDPLRSTAHAS